ncbi:MAG: aspartyl/asparaginyl beta-hydroxylase domain-containing protein [Bradyrhizobium sp.]
MSHFERLPLAFPVHPLLDELAADPTLWNRRRARTGMNGSPHREADDIWVRYKDPPPTNIVDPFESVWYPEAEALPAVRPIVDRLMRHAAATHLGGILITRIPPRKQVYPHHDCGPWHAEFHNYKVYVALQSNPRCVNWFGEDGDGAGFVMEAGQAWRFDNQVPHVCFNYGDGDRLSLIVSMRAAA